MTEITATINCSVRVKLTVLGKELLQKRHTAIVNLLPVAARETLGPYPHIQTDEDGYTHFLLWELMMEFGPYLSHGMIEMPFDSTLLLNPTPAG